MKLISTATTTEGLPAGERAWLPLTMVEALVPQMQDRKVSKVARSKRGFIAAYRRADGDPDKLTEDSHSGQHWRSRRNAFIARHMAQVQEGREPLWEDDGRPTRRHLALAAWAYSPEPAKLKRYAKRQEELPVRGAPPKGNPRTYAESRGLGKHDWGSDNFNKWQRAALIMLQRKPYDLDVGYDNPMALGCGNYGCAYALPDYPGWVLKITGDPTDAAAWAFVGRLGIKGVARAPLVFAFPSTLPGVELPSVYQGPRRLYGVVQEHLEPLSSSGERYLDNHGRRMAHDAREAVEGRHSRRGVEVFTAKASAYFAPNIEDNVRLLWSALVQLAERGVWTDDIRGGNVMRNAAGEWRITDLGVSHAPGSDVPELGTDLSAGELRTLGLSGEELHWMRMAHALKVEAQAAEDDALLRELGIETLPTATSRTIRWGDLPQHFQEDGFILQALTDDVGLPPDPDYGVAFLPSDTRVTVDALPMDEVWREIRKHFPGADTSQGMPTNIDAEEHWDERGPAAVMEIVQVLQTAGLGPHSSAGEILNTWLEDAYPLKWEQPAVKLEYDSPYFAREAWRAAGVNMGEAPSMQMPPIIFVDGQFVDGRHRAFAARLLGLRYIPVIQLEQFKSGVEALPAQDVLDSGICFDGRDCLPAAATAVPAAATAQEIEGASERSFDAATVEAAVDEAAPYFEEMREVGGGQRSYAPLHRSAGLPKRRPSGVPNTVWGAVLGAVRGVDGASIPLGTQTQQHLQDGWVVTTEGWGERCLLRGWGGWAEEPPWEAEEGEWGSWLCPTTDESDYLPLAMAEAQIRASVIRPGEPDGAPAGADQWVLDVWVPTDSQEYPFAQVTAWRVHQQASVPIEKLPAGASRAATAQEIEWASAYRYDNPPEADPAEMDWRVERYPVAKLDHLNDWQQWFEEEQWAYEQRGYDPAAMAEAIRRGDIEEIVVIEDPRGQAIGIWDGWHRSAVAQVYGLDTIPAAVGRLKESVEALPSEDPLRYTFISEMAPRLWFKDKPEVVPPQFDYEDRRRNIPIVYDDRNTVHVLLKPTAFLELTSTPLKHLVDILRPDKVAQYTQAMRSGDRFPVPWMQYDRDKKQITSHEGRHRAAAAMQLGLPAVPVVITIRPKFGESHEREWGWGVDLIEESPFVKRVQRGYAQQVKAQQHHPEHHQEYGGPHWVDVQPMGPLTDQTLDDTFSPVRRHNYDVARRAGLSYEDIIGEPVTKLAREQSKMIKDGVPAQQALKQVAAAYKSGHSGVEKCPYVPGSNPVKWLTDDHDEIRGMCAALIRYAEAGDWERVTKCMRALRVDCEQHFVGEEDDVFPMLEQQLGRPGAFDALVAQHDPLLRMLRSVEALAEGGARPVLQIRELTKHLHAHSQAEDQIAQGLGPIERLPAAQTEADLDRSCPTALHRNGSSAPVRWLHERGLIRGPVLDYGSGHGADVEWLRGQRLQVKGYDPCHGPFDLPDTKYNTVLATYVFNTVPKKAQAGLLREIRDRLKPGGAAFITVRSDVKTGRTSRGTYQRKVKLKLPIEGRVSGGVIYRLDG